MGVVVVSSEVQENQALQFWLPGFGSELIGRAVGSKLL
jgi:hypothetical protein